MPYFAAKTTVLEHRRDLNLLITNYALRADLARHMKLPPTFRGIVKSYLKYMKAAKLDCILQVTCKPAVEKETVLENAASSIRVGAVETNNLCHGKKRNKNYTGQVPGGFK